MKERENRKTLATSVLNYVQSHVQFFYKSWNTSANNETYQAFVNQKNEKVGELDMQT